MKNNKGFTLIELLAVIVTLGIILTIVVRSVIVSIDNAKKETEKVFISKIEDSIEQYIDLNKKDFVLSDEPIGTVTKEISSKGDKKEVKLYKVFKRDENGNRVKFTYEDIIKTEFIKPEDLVNPANENISCGTPSEIIIDIYRDEDFVYYFQTDDFGCINLDNGIDINKLPVDENGDPKYDIKEDDNKPNPPDISNGLVPIKYNGTNWVVTSKNDLDWYDYSKQKWANAAILKDSKDNIIGKPLILPDGDSITEANSNVYAIFVWIPRFSYTIGCTDIDGKNNINTDVSTIKDDFSIDVPTECLGYKEPGASNLSIETPGAIDIKFVSEDEQIENGNAQYEYDSDNRKPDNWYTHPAFKFGDDKLSGIWVGKYETSVNSSSACYITPNVDNCNNNYQSPRILPNVIPLGWQNIYNQFLTSRNFAKLDNEFNLKGDSHMMKNSEWGAVSYLSQSFYGKYGNGSYNEKNKEIAPNPTYYDYSYTGKDSRASSTTGNETGIYDMSGGIWEHMMTFYSERKKDIIGDNSFPEGWFEKEENKKYYDNYESEFLFEKTEQLKGHGLYETYDWYDCYYGAIQNFYFYDKDNNEFNVMARGSSGWYSDPGIFATNTANGTGYWRSGTFRVVLSNK